VGRKIRIGIDVGGTFTDAIALDNDTYEIVAIKKIHSTHSAPEGVTLGVVQVLHGLLEEINADSQDVVFIAHGTTQATNALLEGDVANIGIIALGRGFLSFKSRMDTRLGQINLGSGKFITTEHRFIKSVEPAKELVLEALSALKEAGMQGIVAAEPFSVDHPENENMICDLATGAGIPATATHEISKLYGLKARTKTAVINASILPKMSETAEMTSRAVADAKITAPLMIMRSDGGVMQIDDVRRRPILTVLSGPAAGVAGALMYEKITQDHEQRLKLKSSAFSGRTESLFV
jgi:N-methylhydantoinase A/oxoprolinase/acetone carboxylase beta subunit